MDSKIQPEEKAKVMNDQEIQKRIDAVPWWWHTIQLGNCRTPGSENQVFEFLTPNFQNWIAQVIPEDLTGKSILDIGTWDGYFSFLAEQRGASRVVAIDNLIGRYPNIESEGFMTAREILNSKVNFIQIDLLDIDRLAEEFDAIFFFGVLYHLRHPLLALEKIYQKAKSSVLLETHVIDTEYPLMAFYENDEYGKDPTNWWGPSISCVQAMCRSCGFREIELVAQLGSMEQGETRALFKLSK